MTSVQLLAGKTMAITGGVTGIGRAIALGYLSHGANVAVNHLGDPKSSEQFQSLVEEASQLLGGKETAEKRLVEVPGDVGDPETGKKLVKVVEEKWGRLDVFISNAGICEFREFLEYAYILLCCLCIALLICWTQNHTRPLEPNDKRESHGRFQHHTRCCDAHVHTIPTRRLHNRNI